MLFRLQMILICFILCECKRSSSFYNKSNKISDQIIDKKSSKQESQAPNQEKRDISKNDLDNIGAGDGLTVGNGQNENEKIEDQNKPVEILGSFLTSCKNLKLKLICKISSPPSDVDHFIETLVFYDQSGNTIPSNELKIELKKVDSILEIHIEVPTEKTISQIVEKNTVEKLDKIKNFITDWVSEADYIDNKQTPNIYYSQAPTPPELIVLNCSGNCPVSTLLETDGEKLGALCELLESTDSIEGISYDGYFSSLKPLCAPPGSSNEKQPDNGEIQSEESPSTGETSFSSVSSSSDTETDKLFLGDTLELGRRLVKGKWAMTLAKDSIKIESDESFHEVLLSFSYNSIELINAQSTLKLVAHTDIGERTIFEHTVTLTLSGIKDAHVRIEENGQISLVYYSVSLQKVIIHSAESPWQIPN